MQVKSQIIVALRMAVIKKEQLVMKTKLSESPHEHYAETNNYLSNNTIDFHKEWEIKQISQILRTFGYPLFVSEILSQLKQEFGLSQQGGLP